MNRLEPRNITPPRKSFVFGQFHRRISDEVLSPLTTTALLEQFVDYGMRVRSRSRALQTFLAQLADAYGEGAYIPTQRALDGGHDSAVIKSAWFGPECGEMVVDETVRSIQCAVQRSRIPNDQVTERRADKKVGPESREILVDRTVELINGMWDNDAD